MRKSMRTWSSTNRGDIGHTQIGSCKYISSESLLAFIKENTHRGYHR